MAHYANQGLCNKVFDDVWTERLRQDKIRDEGRFTFTLADPDGLSATQKLAAIVEEIGEVATESVHEVVTDAEGTPQALYKELIQVQALSLAWCEAIRRDELLA